MPENLLNAAELAELKLKEEENAKLRAEQAEKVKEFEEKKPNKLKNSTDFFKKMTDKEFDEYVEKCRKERENIPDDIESTFMDFPEALKDPRFVYYWFNDYQGRLNWALGRKWDFVIDERISTSKNLEKGVPIKVPNGAGTSYLMRIPRVLWEEDQRKVEAKNNELMDAINGRDKSLDSRIKSSKKITKETLTEEEFE